MSIKEGALGSAVALVVEDELLIRLNLADFLIEEGYTVFEAENAGDALMLLEENPAIEVIITDVRMPGSIDGLDLARQVAADRPDVRILVVSGFAGDWADRLPPRAGFLRKPYSYEALKTSLANLP